MLRKIDRLRETGLVLSSAVLLTLSFPNFNLGALAFFAFVPLFFALDKKGYKEAFFLSYLCGLIFFGLTMYWLCHVSILGYVLLISILSVFFGLFGPFFLYAKRYALYAIFLIPASWVVLEYLRSNLFTGFGWALLGYSQYLNLPVIQIADITGAYGVSFLVMLTNVIIFIIYYRRHPRDLNACVAGILVMLAALGYGYFKLEQTDAIFKTLNVSVIQGNIPQSAKWDPLYKEKIFIVYKLLTEDAAVHNPDLIIWPETALPGFIDEKELLDKVKELAQDTKAYLLIGAPAYADPEGERIFNSAVLISEKGDTLERHDKLHLVPFGEYVPLGGWLDSLRNFIDKPIGSFSRGNEYTIFELKDRSRFGVLICFEDIFAALVRKFVAKEADFMVNITNDAWFMRTSAPYQHAQASVLRAVENRVPVIRAANTGLSCFIDRYGRITGSVKISGEEIFVMGHKTESIHPSYNRSFYNKFGDVFTFLCLTAIIITGATSIWQRR